ncbi:MAG: FAD-dependent oxidoreductase [Eubacteriaceae bacterium]|nr:FAD-dependent oxidoreductase [Eubacteriaceae bacterium]
MLKYQNLFTPKQVGNVIFKNRIFASATGHLALNSDGTFTDDFMMYYERKAKGGAAMVTIGECHVDPKTGSRGGTCVDMSNFGTMQGLNRLNDYISRNGSVCSPELIHGGMYANSMGPGVAYGPSACVVEGKEVLEMPEEIIAKIIDSFANAAFLAKMAGCKMVTLHGGHGWLMQQFFSPATNHRTDIWGGTPENRARFAQEVCDAIHKKCGYDFPIEVRISATEFEDGYGVEDGIVYAQQLEGHADLIHVSVGVHGSLMGDSWLKFSPTMFVDDGVNVKYAAEIKKHVKHTPIVTVGSLSDPAMMEDIIASGKADFVAMARQLLCDPDMPNKARAGKDEDIRQCIRCMSCWSNIMSGQLYCALNPETSREKEIYRALPVVGEKKVLIAGGGIAGMEAAIVAAGNGHDVTLVEKSDHLGGVITCEDDVPFKKHVKDYIDYQKRQVEKAGVKVKLNTAVDADYVKEMNPDVLISAIGTKPIVPAIEGIDGENVFEATYAYKNVDKLGSKVTVIGGGLVGSELAIYLDSLGKDVTVVERLPFLNAGSNNTQGMVVRGVFRDRNIRHHLMTNADRITEGGVYCTQNGEELFIPSDSVIVALGQKPLTEEMIELSQSAEVFHAVGDCVEARNIGYAVKEAYTVARNIGKAK